MIKGYIAPKKIKKKTKLWLSFDYYEIGILAADLDGLYSPRLFFIEETLSPLPNPLSEDLAEKILYGQLVTMIAQAKSIFPFFIPDKTSKFIELISQDKIPVVHPPAIFTLFPDSMMNDMEELRAFWFEYMTQMMITGYFVYPLLYFMYFIQKDEEVSGILTKKYLIDESLSARMSIIRYYVGKYGTNLNGLGYAFDILFKQTMAIKKRKIKDTNGYIYFEHEKYPYHHTAGNVVYFAIGNRIFATAKQPRDGFIFSLPAYIGKFEGNITP